VEFSTIYAKTDAQLVDSQILDDVVRKARDEGKSAEAWVVALEHIHSYSGDIGWPNRLINDVPELHLEAGTFESWMREFLKYDPDDPNRKLRRTPQKRVLDRLRLIDLYLQIKEIERSRPDERLFQRGVENHP